MASPIRSFDLTRPLFRWGPLDASPHSLGIPARTIIQDTPKRHGVGWPESMGLFRDRTVTWLNDQAALDAMGVRVLEKFFLNARAMRKTRAEYEAIVERFRALARLIGKANLRTLPLKTLAQQYHALRMAAETFWQYGVLPELAAYGASYLLPQIVERWIPLAERGSALAVFSQADRWTFHQEEERALTQLVRSIRRDRGSDAALTKKLEAHRQRWFWLGNGYGTAKRLPLSWFALRARGIAKNPEKRWSEFMCYRAEHTRSMKKFLACIPPTRRDWKVASVSGIAVRWQDERKGVQLEGEDAFWQILSELGRRVDADIQTMRGLVCDEVEQVFHAGRLTQPLRAAIRKRAGQALLVITKKKYCWEYGPEVRRVIRALEVLDQPRGTMIQGLGVSPGIVTGVVQRIATAKDVGGFKKGRVLVTGMTTPDFIAAIREAAAIVTDTGGVTSHAAVVSRELGIPCVVGTKVATRMLADGVRVEVDGASGAVKRV